MLAEILVYLGSMLVMFWGVGHLIPTRDVVKGFGDLSKDNRNIITMEWVAEGITFLFIGLLVILITLFEGADDSASQLVYRVSAGALLAMAGLAATTGANVDFAPFKMCPFVLVTVAGLYLAGSFA